MAARLSESFPEQNAAARFCGLTGRTYLFHAESNRMILRAWQYAPMKAGGYCNVAAWEDLL